MGKEASFLKLFIINLKVHYAVLRRAEMEYTFHNIINIIKLIIQILFLSFKWASGRLVVPFKV